MGQLDTEVRGLTPLNPDYAVVAQALGAAVARLLEDDELRARLLAAGRTRSRAFPAAASLRRLLDRYQGDLHLALAAAGIGKGDEVITTPFTFIATAEAISYLGATPVFVDIDPYTFNIDLNQVEQAITAKTRAVIPVHLFGQPVDMNALKTLCDDRGLVIVEDCAQSFGAHIDNRMTGSFGKFGAFSFFPSKNLGCLGDGGMVVPSVLSSSPVSDPLLDDSRIFLAAERRQRRP